MRSVGPRAKRAAFDLGSVFVKDSWETDSQHIFLKDIVSQAKGRLSGIAVKPLHGQGGGDRPLPELGLRVDGWHLRPAKMVALDLKVGK